MTTARALAFAVWFSFIIFCVGLNQSHGLAFADDAWFAIIAKSLASGHGYATTFPDPGKSGLILFNPLTGTGPTLIVPCALAFWAFGKSELTPGLIAILIWGGLFTFVLARISQRTDPRSFLLGVILMCGGFVASFSFQFEQWHAFLGEISAVALTLVAHWVLSSERFDGRRALLAGLAFGLALQTKYLVAITAIGLALIFVVRAARQDCSSGQWLRCGAMLLIGSLVPTLIFEGYKWIQLGSHGYAINWQELLEATKQMGMQSGGAAEPTALQHRLGLVYERFGLQLPGLIALNALGVLLTWRLPKSKTWALFSAAILLSITFLAIYWLTLSIGWPRYLAICIAMGVFLLSVPVFTLEWRSKLVFATLALLLLRTGFSRTGYIIDLADHGIFRASSERAAREELVTKIEQLQATQPIILAATWWGSMTDVEFMLTRSENFQRLDAAAELPGPKLILLNQRFDPSPNEAIRKVKETVPSVVYAGGPYELLEVQ